jgi:hypothetical protein
MNIKSKVKDIDFTPIVKKITAWRSNSDIASIGGAVFEAELAKALSDDEVVTYTQKELSTLIDEGYVFDLPVDWDTIKSEAHTIGSPWYACDLFMFTREGVFMDAVSLKTSVTDSNSNVFIVNDNEGTTFRDIEAGHDTYLGKVLIAIVRPTQGTFTVFYFDGYMSEIYDGLTPVINGKGNLVYRGKSKTGRDVGLVTVTNRNKEVTGKTTSFDRGVTVKPGYLIEFADLVTAGTFDATVIKNLIVVDLINR